MIYFVEMWNAKPEWLALSPEERGNYMNQIGPHIQGLIEKGVQVLTWSENEKGTDKRANFDYFAIWTFPDQAIANEFQQLVDGAGWYQYFEQVNAGGKVDTAEGVISKLVGL
ncbi:MAG: DUF6616 family protein [Bacteroidota bacterium]